MFLPVSDLLRYGGMRARSLNDADIGPTFEQIFRSLNQLGLHTNQH